MVAIAFALVGGIAFALWWFSPTSVEVDPPMPPDIQEQDVRIAIESARNKVIEQPTSGDAWGFLGMTLAANLFDREADRCFAEAARFSADSRWPYFRGLIALKRDPDHALPFLRQAVEAAKGSEEFQNVMRLRLAEALLERRELDEAESIFRAELEKNPRDHRSELGLGMAAFARGDDANRKIAEQYFTSARSSPHARKAATLQLAASHADRVSAAAYAKEADSLPEDIAWPDPLREGIMELQVGRRRRERQISQLENQRRFDEAAQLYLRQIRENPTARDYIGAAVNLARLKDYDRALPLLSEALKREPDSSLAHYTLALVQFTRAERQSSAIPGSSEVSNPYRDCVEHARRAAELKPSHAQAYQFWGLALNRLGEFTAAVVPLRKGVECQPTEIELQLGLAEALLQTKHYGEAARCLDNAKSINPADPRIKQMTEELSKKKSEAAPGK